MSRSPSPSSAFAQSVPGCMELSMSVSVGVAVPVLVLVLVPELSTGSVLVGMGKVVNDGKGEMIGATVSVPAVWVLLVSMIVVAMALEVPALVLVAAAVAVAVSNGPYSSDLGGVLGSSSSSSPSSAPDSLSCPGTPFCFCVVTGRTTEGDDAWLVGRTAVIVIKV
ncbi:hypothetical protein QBC32DRAFT_329634 [Pseudoneurospora amorphoporcata]|uniref:Uncharacterized protein n=1 Tax=Pseudoneurospora amorphoporcata TaxID=241081 RepID=A0AAN6SJY4_9PEZI|nr:hypothetical protein QBC32DRAFT_329634 [Pseudoneurospora amorphoporcata]